MGKICRFLVPTFGSWRRQTHLCLEDSPFRVGLLLASHLEKQTNKQTKTSFKILPFIFIILMSALKIEVSSYEDCWLGKKKRSEKKQPKRLCISSSKFSFFFFFIHKVNFVLSQKGNWTIILSLNYIFKREIRTKPKPWSGGIAQIQI